MAPRARKSTPVSGLLAKTLEKKHEQIVAKLVGEVKETFEAEGFGRKNFRPLVEGLYGIVLEHIRKPSQPIGGETLEELIKEEFKAGTPPRLVGRIHILLRKEIIASLSRRSPYYQDMCDVVEDVIDECRLRSHQIHFSLSARELEESRRKTELFAAISRINTALISADLSEERAKIIDSELRGIFQFDALVVCLIRDEWEHIVCHRVIHEDEEQRVEGDFLPIKSSPLMMRLREGNRILYAEPGAAAEARDDPLLKGVAVESLLAHPMLSRDECIGAIALCAKFVGAFSEEDAGALREVANELAAALHNIRLTEMGKRRTAELAMIAEVSRIVSSEADIKNLMVEVASAVQRTFSYYDVSLFLVDKESNEVVMTAQAGALDDLFAKGYRQKIGEGMVGWTAQHGETLLANDVTKEPRFLIASELEREVKSELCVPIKVGDEVTGVINVESKELGAFDKRDVSAIETLSRQMAKAVESARIESDARRVQKYLNQVMTHLPIAVNSFDLNGVYTHWSIGSERMFGYSAEEMVGKRTPDFILKDGHDLKAFMESCAQQGSHIAEVKGVTKDGRELWIHQAMANLYDDAGNHIGYTACLQDITTRKEAELQLLQEKQKLMDVLTAMGAAVSLIDRELTILWSNKTVSEWFAPGEDVCGQHCYKIYLGRDTVCQNCVAMQVFADGATRNEEHVITLPDGTRRHFLSTVTPVRDTEGNIIHVLKLTQDITEHAERMHQLDLLRQFGQILQETLELDRLMFLILTCVTAGPGLGFNRAFLLLVNRDENRLEGRMAVGPANSEEAARIYFDEELRRRSLRELLEEYDSFTERRDHPINQLARSMVFSLNETGEIPVQAVKMKRPVVVEDAESDPRVTPKMRSFVNANQFVCVPLMARGEAIGVILADNLYSGQPITPAKVNVLRTFANQAGLALDNAEAYERLEDNYRQLAEARDRLLRSERLAAIGSMAAHVAHEIRNPLVTIGGFARSIVRQTDPHTECHQSATIIAEEVARLEKILANVMDFTRPSFPKKVPAHINEIVRAACDFLKGQLEEKKIELELTLAGDLPVLMIDPDQMRQVLLNLIKNAMESLHSGGIIEIETAQQRDYVRISIKDNGPGIPAELLENMFNPFFTTKPDGTGLGLAVTRKIVEDHGGEIIVKSTAGEGSTFTVLLPKEGA